MKQRERERVALEKGRWGRENHWDNTKSERVLS